MSSSLRLVILRTAFWVALLFSFAMAVIPQPPQLPGGPSDKLQHIGAFALLAALGFFAYPQVKRVRLGIGLSLFGALIELVQAIPALQRDSDVLDWIADTVSVAVVLLVLSLLWTRWNGTVRGA